MKIRKGDTVEVIRGEEKGTRGTVREVVHGKSRDGAVDPNGDRVFISGVNMVKKHQRRTGDVRTQVGIIEREASVHVSNVALVCPHCNKAARVGYLVQPDGSKVRVCKNCHETIE